MTKTNKPQSAVLDVVQQHFGLCPTFFAAAEESGCAKALWGMAQFAYIEAPFPSLFKEKLFVYLSRFSLSSYCFSRHAAFLGGLGHAAGDSNVPILSADQIMDLLKIPQPRVDQLAEVINHLEKRTLAEEEWEPDRESDLIGLASLSYRRQSGCQRVEKALARYLGPTRYDRFITFLGFIRLAHLWTEAHRSLAPESDITRWLENEPELAAWIRTTFPQIASNATDTDANDADRLAVASATRAYPIPDGESDRLTALRLTGLLDSEAEEAYDDLARLAAGICDTPIALISLVDEDRQWFKARVGIDATETPRDVSFCAHAICQPGEVMVVPDATADDRFRENSLVTGEPGIRFYAGVPLSDHSGQSLGTLCVIDRQPREFTPMQSQALVALSRQFSLLLEMRHTNNRLQAEIAHRKQIEKRLQIRAESFHDLVENAVDLIQSVAPDGRFIYVNAAWCQTLGYDSQTALTLNAFDVVAPECRDECRKHLETVMSGGKVNCIDVTFLTSTGGRVQLTGRINCRRDNDMPVATRGIFRINDTPSFDNDDSFACICGWCKKFREDDGSWVKLENYLTDTLKLPLSHGICEPCAEDVLKDMESLPPARAN